MRYTHVMYQRMHKSAFKHKDSKHRSTEVEKRIEKKVLFNQNRVTNEV